MEWFDNLEQGVEKLSTVKMKMKTTASVPEQIARRLRDEVIVDCFPGEQLPSVIDLASRFGVSKHSISTAFEILARDGIVLRRPGRGVYVSRNLRRWRIGILSELNLLDPRIGLFYRAQADALKRQFVATGCEAHLYMGHYVAGPAGSGDTTCPQFWAELAAGRLDGVVILDAPYRSALGKRIRSCPVPAVGSMTGFEARIDFKALTTAAVQRLAAQGCRKIGILGWSCSGAELFRQAIADCGLTPNDAWIRCDLDASVGGAGWEEFREIWSARGGRPDGLVVLDEMLFADAQLAIFELGVRVPQELQLAIQITGGSTLPIRLPATLYEVDPDEAAALHVALLVDRLEGRTPAVAVPTIPFHERTMAEMAPSLAAGVAKEILETVKL